VTRGENVLSGQYAVVDTNKNVARLLSAPPSARLTSGRPPRVEGLLIPRRNDDTAGASSGSSGTKAATTPPAAPAAAR